MTHEQTLPTQPAPVSLLAKRMLIGAAIGLAVISVFIFGGGRNAPAAWGEYWRVKPLLLTPTITAIGALCFHYWIGFFKVTGWQRIVVIALGIIGFVISLWLGIVLGLNGTMWN